MIIDALSRREEPAAAEVRYTAITIVESLWLKDVQFMVLSSNYFEQLKKKLKEGSVSP